MRPPGGVAPMAPNCSICFRECARMGYVLLKQGDLVFRPSPAQWEGRPHCYFFKNTLCAGPIGRKCQQDGENK